MWWTQYLLPIFFLGLIVWTHYILFVGDEREMVDCSKIEVFFEELDRMCKTVNKDGEVEDCAFYKPNYGCCGYMSWLPDGVEKAVTVLQKWSDEHPKKTRQSEFLKMFPNAQMERRHLAFCPKLFDTASICIKDGSGGCRLCIEKYWSEEVE